MQQIQLVGKWLKFKLLLTFLTEWNSSETAKEITSKGKKKARPKPTRFSLLHTTDFADRYERNISSLLRAGYMVLADRYVYTAYTRYIVRGCIPKWICKYIASIKPDIVFYFTIPVDIAIERILSGRPKLKYYETGMDLNLSNNPYERYRIFQSKIIDQYESMIESEGFTIIDGTADIEEQQQLVRQKNIEILQPQPKTIRQYL
jgi:dTMP kinase